MTKERSLFGQFVFGGDPSRADREEKVLRYVIHRMDEDGAFHDVLEEPYVRRNCSQEEIDEIRSHPEIVQACREHLEGVFRSGELDPTRHLTPGRTPRHVVIENWSRSWQRKKLRLAG